MQLLIHSNNTGELREALNKQLAKHGSVIVTLESGFTGKWSMTRLWRSWMASTASFMANNGAVMPLCVKPGGEWYGSRPFNADDAHELFTAQWLGVDEKGKRYSWAKKPRDGMIPAPKGQRIHAMQKQQVYMLERGIQHLNPRDSEYYESVKRQEE